MKTKLLFITLLCTIGFGFASTTHKKENSYYNNQNSFTFVEGNITFSVFPNGEFDFYIQPRQVNVYANYGALNISYNSGYNYSRYVQYDAYGAIIQIENVPVFYDYYGRVNRIGNIQLNYRNNRLRNVGNLQIFYHNNGYYSHHVGYVNYYNRKYAYRPYYRYFIKPAYNKCVVSYQPYRKHYKPNRTIDRKIGYKKYAKRDNNQRHAKSTKNYKNTKPNYERNSSRKKEANGKYYVANKKNLSNKRNINANRLHSNSKKYKRNTYQKSVASRN